MNNQQNSQQNLLHSVSSTFQHLFIAERDLAYIYWCLGVITLMGMIMRMWKLNEPIAYDEAYTFIYFASREFKHILADYSAPNNHIFHTILVYISHQLIGGHTWIVRLPAFIAGTLCIPAAYFAARRMFNSHQSLAACALIALTPWFITYSTNGRGYTLLSLLALLLANFAGILVHQQSRSALIAFAITAAFGFYTIPIFLYPMAGISLWVFISYLTTSEAWKSRRRKILIFIAACVAAGISTLLLYSPVIFFGTGLDSITNNEIVEPRDWGMFVENLRPRAVRTWESWMVNIAPPLQHLLLGGFLVSLLFYRKASKQRIPLQIFMLLSILILLAVQRVVPLPRVWIYLEVFYMLFAGAGLVWVADLAAQKFVKTTTAEKIAPAIILLAVAIVFTGKYLNTRQESVITNYDDIPEQQAADYLSSHLKAEDTIVSVAPVDIRTAYYLYMQGIPYDIFYQRDHPVEIHNALVILRTTSNYNTPESVLSYYSLTPELNLKATQLVFAYGPLNIFSIPAK